jgi:hypothetical protein
MLSGKRATTGITRKIGWRENTKTGDYGYYKARIYKCDGWNLKPSTLGIETSVKRIADITSISFSHPSIDICGTDQFKT